MQVWSVPLHRRLLVSNASLDKFFLSPIFSSTAKLVFLHVGRLSESLLCPGGPVHYTEMAKRADSTAYIEQIENCDLQSIKLLFYL